VAPFRSVKNLKAIGVLAGALVCAGLVAIAMFAAARAEVSGESPDERLASVRSIAARRPSGAADALARAAANDTSARVREAALAGLTHCLEPKHRSVVEDGTRDADAGVRAIAADTLGLYADSPSADVLIKLIQNDPDERVRLAACRGLARCDDPRSIVVLLETADKSKRKGIRLQAMKSLLVKFKGKLSEKRDPGNEAVWRDLVQRFKWDQRVRDAYSAAGARLVDRPQDILGKDWHPERH